MNNKKIWQEIEIEARSDRKKKPGYPDHVVAQSAMVSSAAGNLITSAINFKYRLNEIEVVADFQKENLREEAIKVCAAAIRFIQNLK